VYEQFEYSHHLPLVLGKFRNTREVELFAMIDDIGALLLLQTLMPNVLLLLIFVNNSC
jgi:hypothetical protein